MENVKSVLYVHLFKDIDGLIKVPLLFYKKTFNCLKEIGFSLNPYEPCTRNRILNQKQHTIVWHIDDVK